jgi:Ca2+-transporting ATPase
MTHQPLSARIIGVAMGITERMLPRKAADMVLTDDKLSSIVSAGGAGPHHLSRIFAILCFFLLRRMSEIMIIFWLRWRVTRSINAIQHSVVNLITTVHLALALAIEKGDPDIMQPKAACEIGSRLSTEV